MADIRVGTASWTDKTLIESGWYPPEANNAEKRLRYYTRQFPLVEVDSTYYALPSGADRGRLGGSGPPEGFTFNIKAFSLFTQHPTRIAALPKDLRPAAEKAAKGKPNVYLKDAGHGAHRAGLGPVPVSARTPGTPGRLGAILFQFPPWFPVGERNRTLHPGMARSAASRCQSASSSVMAAG